MIYRIGRGYGIELYRYKKERQSPSLGSFSSYTGFKRICTLERRVFLRPQEGTPVLFFKPNKYRRLRLIMRTFRA